MTGTTATVLTDDNTDVKTGETKTEVKTDEVKSEVKTEVKADEVKAEVKQELPEKYDLKLPEDLMFSADEVLMVEKEARELGLNQEKAQKLLEARNEDRVKYKEGQTKVFTDAVKAWAEALPSDQEIAGKDGTEYAANIARAKQALDKFGSPKLKQELDKTGLGNHPELVRLFVRIGKAMKEDSFHTGSSTGDVKPGDPEMVRAGKFYSTSKG